MLHPSLRFSFFLVYSANITVAKTRSPEGEKAMSYTLITLEYEGDFATITMNYPQRRNALSLKHMLELT